MNTQEILIFIGLTLIAIIIAKIKIKFQKKISEKDKNFIKTKWQKITNTNNNNQAILDADKLLQISLQKIGIKGSVGEQLKNKNNKISNINEIWEAHKIRNKIAHEFFEPNEKETQLTLKKYKKTIEEIIKTKL